MASLPVFPKEPALRPILSAATAFFLLSSAPAFAAPGVAGTYQVEGWNPGTAANAPADYKGTLVLDVRDGAIVADWNIANQHTAGLGIMRDVGGKAILSIGYENGDNPGIVVYDVSPDGKVLTGTWGPGGRGRETNKR